MPGPNVPTALVGTIDDEVPVERCEQRGIAPLLLFVAIQDEARVEQCNDLIECEGRHLNVCGALLVLRGVQLSGLLRCGFHGPVSLFAMMRTTCDTCTPVRALSTRASS